MKKRAQSINKKRKVSRFIYWTPRILSILFLLFLAMFSLDIFDSCAGFSGCAIGLFMHNLPVLILAVLLWISWKREIVGAIAFALGGFLYIGIMARNAWLYAGEWYMLSYSMIIAGPAFVIAFLFYLNWKKRKH